MLLWYDPGAHAQHSQRPDKGRMGQQGQCEYAGKGWTYVEGVLPQHGAAPGGTLDMHGIAEQTPRYRLSSQGSGNADAKPPESG